MEIHLQLMELEEKAPEQQDRVLVFVPIFSTWVFTSGWGGGNGVVVQKKDLGWGVPTLPVPQCLRLLIPSFWDAMKRLWVPYWCSKFH